MIQLLVTQCLLYCCRLQAIALHTHSSRSFLCITMLPHPCCILQINKSNRKCYAIVFQIVLLPYNIKNKISIILTQGS